MRIFIYSGDETRGPYSLPETKRLLDAGIVNLSDLASFDGRRERIPLSSVPGIADVNSSELNKPAARANRPLPSETSRPATTRSRPQTVAGPWEVICPHCVDIIGTPDTLFCPNCTGPLALEGGFATSLKCVRCANRIGSVKCGDCGSVASGSYIRKTVTAAKTLSNPSDEASAAVCPACGSTYTNKIRDTGCATVFWFLVSLPFFLIPYFIFAFMARYRLPNTKCLGCGHEWNAKINRG